MILPVSERGGAGDISRTHPGKGSKGLKQGCVIEQISPVLSQGDEGDALQVQHTGTSPPRRASKKSTPRWLLLHRFGRAADACFYIRAFLFKTQKLFSNSEFFHGSSTAGAQ